MPQAVPPATGNNAVITVKVGGSRSGTSGVTSLAGVELGFYDAATGGTPAFTCTSDADGDCSIVVPNTQAVGGVNRNRRFWVRQVAAPAGWYTNPSLGTGTTVAADPYRFQTGTALQNGQTYSSTVNFMIGTGNENNQASGGIWQNSLDNPDFPAQCGINVAIVHDLSNSVTDAQLVSLKAASQSFVDSLTGTPSAVSTFTFASNAPATGATNTTLPLTSVATAAGATSVKNKIAGFTKPGGNAGGTNWDRGFAQVAESTSSFDVAVLITDGNPTFYGQNVEGPGSRTRFREVENGIFSANAIKATGTRVVAVGVGDGVGNAGSGQNLRAISGTTLNDDYYQSANYAEAAQQLRALALGSCQGSVSVVKQVVPPSAPPGSTAGALPAPGWTFTATGSAPGVTITPPAFRVTGETGAVNFPLEFAGGTTSGAVSFIEEVQGGFTLQPVNGFNATCVRTDTGAAVPSTNSGAVGFSVTANAAFPISCTVYNRAPNPPVTVTVNKQWVIDGTPFADGAQPSGFIAAGSIDGVDAPWGVAQSGYFLNDVVEIGEVVDLSTRPGCTLDSQQLTSRNGTPVSVSLPADETLTQTANTYTVTNVVTCTSRLTLEKQIRGGTGDPTDWTLTSIAPDGALEGPAGATGSDSATLIEVTPGVRYGLTESEGDVNFVQFEDPNAVIPAGNSGSWTCQQIGPDGEVIPGYADGLNGGVNVPLGYDVRCTTFNDTARLALRKVVENPFGGSAVPSDWSLTATPVNGPAGLQPVTVTGSTAVEPFNIRPGVEYTLTESGGPPGYTFVDLTCAIGPAIPASTRNITIQAQFAGLCTFTNREQPAHLTLVKDVTNDDGGTAEPEDWTLSADGPTPISGASGSAAVTGAEVSSGSYDLSEAGGPTGYTAGDWDCGDATLEGATVTVPSGGDVTCTIVNDDEPGTLTLVKEVTNDNGGTAEPTEWTLSADGPTTGVSGPTGSVTVTGVTVNAGSYALAETGPSGYTPSDWVCITTDGELPVVAGAVSVANGADVTCTVVNDDEPGTLTLVKEVVNDDGGTAEATEWTLTADGPTSITGTTGAAEVTGATVDAGAYDLSEAGGPVGYTAGDWDCGSATLEGATVTVPNGGDVTCTIVNDDEPGTLTLVKEVTNDDGGTAEATEWTLTADGPTSITGATGTPAVTAVEVDAGGYALSETGGPAGYTAGDWDCGEATMEGANVAVGLGADVTCTIVNDDEPGSLTLVKEVVNDNGGAADPTDWTLAATGGETTITGVTGAPAVTGAEVDAGDYDLSESDGPAGYTPSEWDCGEAALAGATVTVPNGSDVTCTITNTYDAPTLTLVKEVVNDDGGTAAATDWTLSATGPSTHSGVTGSDAVTAVSTAAGAYALAESGPSGYTASDWECVATAGEAALDGATITLAPGDDVTCTITNDDDAVPPASTWTVVKSSDPPSGSDVDPGDVVTYTVRAGIVSGTSVDGVTVVDDLSRVLDHATLVEGSITASAGSASVSGTTLTWAVGTLTGTQTLTYRVTVDDDARDVVLRNVVTGDGAQPCPPDGPELSSARAAAAAEDCRTTTHETPPEATPPTPPPDLPFTGGPAGWISVLALLMLVVGAWLIASRNRRAAADDEGEGTLEKP